jgi:fructosamine-3-kinase
MESALKDVEVFANQFEWNGNVVNPKKVPWVLVGASYSGQRMAMLRDLYPETFYAAYASSAPMQFVYNYDTCICCPH